jgi:hypothetical protein
MGIEIINLGRDHGERGKQIPLQDLSPLSFSSHSVANPQMSIWLMSAAPGQPVFPWWTYSAKVEESSKKLNDLWGVTSAQSFFDCIFLSQLRKHFGSNLYVIFPGNIRVDGWDKLPESSKALFLKGQECVYHLEGAFGSKLSINWVPFSQPQRIVKNPSFGDMWKLFLASRSEDPVMSISYFTLTNPRTLPEAIQLLIHPSENRSEEFSKQVDWFGLYSSPLNSDHAACSVAYARFPNILGPVTEFQKQFTDLIEQTRFALNSSPTPETVFRILSRIVAL